MMLLAYMKKMTTIQHKLRYVGVAAWLCTSLYSNAQQKPHYTQYILNNYILNPALSGIENYTDVKLSHRHQWVGLQDAPVTSYLSIHGSIGKKDHPRPNTSIIDPYADPENPRGNKYWEDYEAANPHHGVGLQVINDQAGPFQNTSLMGTYAYHMRLNKKTNIAAGIGLGFSSFRLNTNKLFFGEDFPVDPAIASGGVLGRARLNANAGLWVYSDKYFIGLSANQLLPTKIEYAPNLVRLTDGKLQPHLFATAGYRFLIQEDFNLIPSVMVKKVGSIPVQVDVNAKLQYRDLLWVAASYRAQYGFAAFAGFNVLNRVSISYAYDYTTTRLNTVSRGTHEILLGFALGRTADGLGCPRNIW